MTNRENDAFKVQAKTILNLQEQIRLLNFDLSKNKKIMTSYKIRINQARKTILKVRDMLAEIQKTEDYKKISEVINMLRDVGGDE